MTVSFFINKDDKKKVIKNDIELIAGKQCKLKDSFSIITPRIEVEYNDILLSANYLYIEELKRYYFVTKMWLENGRYMVFECSADDLMNWKKYLKNKKFYIERQQYQNSALIVDNLAPTFNDRVLKVQTLGTFGTTPTIYLNTTGGVQ